MAAMPSIRLSGLLALLLVLLVPAAAPGQDEAGTGLPIPRFVSLGSNLINVRTGPGPEFPIQWVFEREGWPVKIVGEAGNWRRIEDIDGEMGWVHGSLLQGRRMIVVAGGEEGGIEPLRRTPQPDARIVLRAENGVLGRFHSCRGGWCLVEIADRRGWIESSKLWGVLASEAQG